MSQLLKAIEAKAELIAREWLFAEDESNFDDACKIIILGYQLRTAEEWTVRSFDYE